MPNPTDVRTDVTPEEALSVLRAQPEDVLESLQRGLSEIVSGTRQEYSDILEQMKPLLSRSKLTVAELATQLGRDAGEVQEAVDKLVELGLINPNIIT